MEPVKLASGHGGHGPQILYPGGRHPPAGHPVHPTTTRSHEGSPYKETISPPMVSRGSPYPSYATVDGGGAPRYIQQQPTYMTYQRDYGRTLSDRPVLMPHATRRPSIMGSYGYSRGDIMPQMLPTATIPVAMDVSSRKRMKLSQPMKPDVRLPLVIDTDTNHSSRESSYYPQVEAISPTLPTDPRDGGSPLHSTKDDLIKQIEQVDKEISLAESSISNLEKKEKDLRAAAEKGDTTAKSEVEDNKETKHQSTAQVIYAQNRKIAGQGHKSLIKLVFQSEIPRVLPLYHQPSDTDVYQENKAKYVTFKSQLLEYFKRRQENKSNREHQLTQTYSRLMTDWMRRVDKMENSKKHREKLAKNREMFEKVFPELRKQREDKERLSRVGARVKSDAEMEEIIDGLQDQENEDKKMRAYTVIPPILLDDKRRGFRYINRNGVIDDPIGEYKEQKNVNIWNEHESEIFKDKYLQHPKNFVLIGSYLERKSVSDCIHNYYLTKKKENYKLLVKRRMRRPRIKGGNNQPSADSLVTLNSSGVTTRGSAAAAQKELMKIGSSPSLSQPPPQTLASSSASPPSAQSISATSEVTVNGANLTTPWSHSSDDMVVTSSSNQMISSEVSCKPNDTSSINQEVREKDKENLSFQGDKLLRKERLQRDDDKMDSSDEENISERGRVVEHECVVCQVRLQHYRQSRAIAPNQASQYGLGESSIGPNARVCCNCKTRSLRRRIPQCPIPTCTNAKWRVKRLRPFPSRWNLLPATIRDPIIKELKIPNDVCKSCSSCLNKIILKLGSDAEEPLDQSRWSPEDIKALHKALQEVGCHWSKVIEKVSNKTQGQCKSFYFNLKGKYQLDEAVSEYKKSKGKSDPPSVTDEEESGSTTSSCDEPGTLPPPQHNQIPHQIRHDSASDTASASSPPPVNNIDERKEPAIRDEIMKEPLPPGSSGQGPSSVTREDYDSSATASADEGQGGVGRDSPEVQHIPHPGERKTAAPSLVAKIPPPPRSIPPPPTTATSSSSPGAPPLFRQIIDQTVEDSIAKLRHDTKGFHDKSSVVGEEMTITSLLGLPPFNSQKKAPWTGYPSIEAERSPQPPNIIAPTYEVDCLGSLDLTVKKRDRSPTGPPHPPSSSIPSRDIPAMTVRGGAEVIVTGKGSPPRAHSNSISYSQPPVASDHRYLQDFRKSPFPGESSRSSASVVPTRANRIPSPLAYVNQDTRQGFAPKIKSSMAPPMSTNAPRASHLSALPQFTNAGRVTKPEKNPMALHGSITHGTPVNQHNLSSVPQTSRYELISKPMLAREGGSITQGTPVHHEVKRSAAALTKEVMFEPTRSSVEIIPRPANFDREQAYRASQRPSGPTTYPYSNRPPLYSDSQMSSRQIIETDYLTSIQMTVRRGPPLIEKDHRISPRGVREPAAPPPPPPPSRDHRAVAYSSPITNLERRDNRVLDARVDQRADHSIEFRPINIQSENDKRKMQFVKTPHGYMHIHSQSPAPHYLTASDVRVSRPSASPVSVRDATPTPPSTESPHDFRSPGMSTPTPPPARISSVIQRRQPSKPPNHLPPPKSGSPHPDSDRYSPRHHSTLLPSALVSEGLTIDILRGYQDGRRSALPPPQHDGQQQLEGISKQLIESYINESHEKDVHPVDIRSDDRRYQQERMDYRSRSKKEAEENDKKINLNYVMDANKAASSPKIRGPPPNEALTAANLIEAIITNQINQGTDENNRGVPAYRRESELPGHSEIDNRNRSPAYHLKEKEIVTVDEVSDSVGHRSHKEVLMAHHSNMAKVHLEYAESKKIMAGGSQFYARSPLEITRTDGRSIAHLNMYDQVPKMRPSDKKDPNERFDSRSPHRLANNSSHMTTDERQIIRIAQSNRSGSSDNAFDLIKNRIKEIWREEDKPSDRRCHPSRGMASMIQQRPLPNMPGPSHHAIPHDDLHVNKRPRLDLPPETSICHPRPSEAAKDDVADSPQSGEMVIDESPRGDLDKVGGGGGRAPSQYAYGAPYRGSGSSSSSHPSSNWGRTQGYEPNCEPVSDEETKPN